MPACPQCRSNIPQSVITASRSSAIVCPHCNATLQANLRNRFLMNMAPWAFAAVTYIVLVALGVDRGLAFGFGLLVALSAGFALARFTRLVQQKSGSNAKDTRA